MYNADVEVLGPMLMLRL